MNRAQSGYGMSMTDDDEWWDEMDDDFEGKSLRSTMFDDDEDEFVERICNSIIGDDAEKEKEEEKTLADFAVDTSNDRELGLAQPSHRFIINPQHHLRLGWDVFIILLVIGEMIIVPYRMTFVQYQMDWQEDADFSLFLFWTWFVFGSFAIDLTINFLTGYFCEGVLVMRQGHILHHYIYGAKWFGWFWIDFFTTIPWGELASLFSGSNSGVAFTSLLKFLKVARFAKALTLFARIQEILDARGGGYFLQLVRICLFLFMAMHYMACLFFYIGSPPADFHAEPLDVQQQRAALCAQSTEVFLNSAERECGWVLAYNVYLLPASNLWLISLGWSSAVLLGSETKVIASTEREIMVQVLSITVGFFIGSWVVSKLLSIIQQMNHEAQAFQEKMKAINRFMVSRNVPVALQFKVKRYLEFQYMARSSGDDNLVLLDSVSPWLKLELTAHLHKKIICRHRFYRSLPSEVVNRICAIAKTYLYATGDVVVQRGEVALCSIKNV